MIDDDFGISTPRYIYLQLQSIKWLGCVISSPILKTKVRMRYIYLWQYFQSFFINRRYFGTSINSNNNFIVHKLVKPSLISTERIISL